MLRPRIEADATVWETAVGSLRIEVPWPHLALVTFRGHFADDFIEPLAALADRFNIAARPTIVFHDWEGMSNYDISARLHLVALALRHQGRTKRIHFLAGSTMIRIGIAVANLALSKFEVHAGRQSFEDAYARAIAEGASPVAPHASARVSAAAPGETGERAGREGASSRLRHPPG
jgi:hypothetical protein